MGIDSLCILFAILMGVLAFLRCPHAWELVDKAEIEAPFELAAKCGVQPKGYYPSQLPQLLMRKVILVIRCPKCGTAKVIRS